MLINKNGAVNPLLVDLVYLQGLEVGSVTPQSLNDILQEVWVKAKGGKFRAQLGGRFPTDEEMSLLKQLGADAVLIDHTAEYRGTLVLGATLKAIVRRMDFMMDEEDRIRACVPMPVYFLGSSRNLDLTQEMAGHVPAILKETGASFVPDWQKNVADNNWPKSEIQMMAKVRDWLGATHWTYVLVLAPSVPKEDGTYRPANTAETVKDWLDCCKGPGRYLIVSSQPFCENQKMAVERAVKEAGEEGYIFDVCGPAAPPLPLSRWLDNLAKQLWEEVQLL